MHICKGASSVSILDTWYLKIPDAKEWYLNGFYLASKYLNLRKKVDRMTNFMYEGD